MAPALKKRLGFAVRLLLALGCAVYAFWGLDYPRLLRAVAGYRPGPVAWTFAFSLAQYGVGALRLSFLGRGAIGFRRAFQANLFCLGMNNLFPARLGEVAKLTFLKRTAGVPLKTGIGIVFWERFFDLNVLLVLTLASAADLGESMTLYVLLGICGSVWAGLAALLLFPRLVERLNGLVPSQALRRHLGEFAERLREGLAPRLLAGLALQTAVLWTLNIVFYWLVICWIGEVSLRPSQLAIAFVIMALGYNVPASPGGLGLFEASVVLSLGWFGVARETALSISLLIRAMQYIPTLPAALLILGGAGLSARELRIEQESLSEAQDA